MLLLWWMSMFRPHSHYSRSLIRDWRRSAQRQQLLLPKTPDWFLFALRIG
jgi:hypothetical protein